MVPGGKMSEGNLPDATVVAAWPLNTPWNAVMVCSLQVSKLETGLMLAPQPHGAPSVFQDAWASCLSRGPCFPVYDPESWKDSVWRQAGCVCVGGDSDLGLSDLVAPLVDVHLLQQGRDDLPAGLGVLGQQHLELLCEILGDFGRERRIRVSATNRDGSSLIKLFLKPKLSLM